MAQFSTNFDEYSTGAIGTVTSGVIVMQAQGPADWTNLIVDLGSGDHAFRIDRGASGGSALNIAVLDAFATSGPIDVVAAVTLGSTPDTNYFFGAALAGSTNWIYGIRNSAANTYRLGVVDDVPANRTSIGAAFTMTDPTAGTTIWQRIARDESNVVMGKIWTGAAGDQPGAWAWSATNTQAELATVKPAMYGFRPGDRPFTFTWFGVGTGGDAAPMPGGGAPTLTDAGDEAFYDGETGVVFTGTGIDDAAATLILSPTDDPDDVDAVAQTVTGRTTTSITATIVRGSLPLDTTLYAFVINGDDSVNASGLAVQIQARVFVRLTLKDLDGNPVANETGITMLVWRGIPTTGAPNPDQALTVSTNGSAATNQQIDRGSLSVNDPILVATLKDGTPLRGGIRKIIPSYE